MMADVDDALLKLSLVITFVHQPHYHHNPNAQSTE